MGTPSIRAAGRHRCRRRWPRGPTPQASIELRWVSPFCSLQTKADAAKQIIASTTQWNKVHLVEQRYNGKNYFVLRLTYGEPSSPMFRTRDLSFGEAAALSIRWADIDISAYAPSKQ